MRIERTGEIEPLTPRVERFFTEVLGGVSMDAAHLAEVTRIDYSCLRGLLAIEIKTLEEPAEERLENLAEELRQRDDWPVFLGSAPVRSFIENTNDPEAVSRRVVDRIGRAIINHLKKANKQLKAHATAFPRRSLLRLVTLVNEDHEIYDPHTVSHILWHAVRHKEHERLIYDDIDAIFYLTQRHAVLRGDLVTFPILMVEGRGVFEEPWKAEALKFIARRWSRWNGLPDVDVDLSVDQFSTIQHIPQVATRSEWWRIEYQRRPYLESLSKEELRNAFDENAVLSLLCFLKNPPITLSQEQRMTVMRRFSDLTQELGERGIPITEFPYEPDRHIAAAKRLRLSSDVVTWLTEIEGARS